MSYVGEDTDGGFTGINVTPLTDVMLVLLCTFLLSASSLDTSRVEIPLPQVQTLRELESSFSVVIVERDGRVLWEDNSWDELDPKEAFEKLLAESEFDVLALGFHREGDYGDAYRLLEAAQLAGWREVVILTDEIL